MSYIVLAVTSRVLQQVTTGNVFQRQLAIRERSAELSRINDATAQNQKPVKLNGAFVLSVGDTGAIWEVHQAAGTQADDFADLFNLLARRPGVAVRFDAE